MVFPKLGVVIGVAAGGALAASNELDEEGGVEADEDDPCKKAAGFFVVHFADHFGPPVVHACQEGEQGGADHDVVKVGDHKVGVVVVDVGGQGAQGQAGEAADGEQPDEAQGVDHGGVHANAAVVHGGQPVKDLDGRGNGNRHGQQAEDRVEQGALAAGEHVVAPHDETKHGDGQ